MERTKALEQCEAEALLMGDGWVYSIYSHTFYKGFRTGKETPAIIRYLCAETLQPVSWSNLYSRARGYAEQQANKNTRAV